MRVFLLGGLILGLPAVAVAVLLWGSPIMIPALASLLVAIVPFLAFVVHRSRSRTRTGHGPEEGD